MALIVMPSLLSKRPWARIRARCEASFFIVFSKSVRCCSVRGSTYLTLIDLESGCTYHIVWELQREILYQKTFGLALIVVAGGRRGRPRPPGGGPAALRSPAASRHRRAVWRRARR